MSRRFWVLLAVFIIGAAVQAWVFPPMEGSDEPLHVAYVAYLRAEHRLPERTTYLENCTRQQSGQPPLVYGVAALLLDAIRAPNPGCEAIFDYYFGQTDNRWLLTPRPLRRDDNNTNFLPVTTIDPPPGMHASLYAIRLTSVMFGALAVVGAYLAAGEIFRQERWRLLTVVIFAFTPTLFHVSAYFSNDPAAAAFTTLVLWRALHLLNRGVTVRRLLVIGVLAGLGALAKASVVLSLGAVGVAVLLAYMRPHPPAPSSHAARGRNSLPLPNPPRRQGGLPPHRNDSPLLAGEMSQRGRGGQDYAAITRRVVVAGLWVALPVALTFGVWVLWGALTYGDPLGTNTHVHPVLNYDPPRPWGDTLRSMPDVYLTYVGLLGYANVYMHPATYAALTGVLLLALVGYTRPHPPAPSPQAARGSQYAPLSRRYGAYALVLFVLWLAVFIGFMRWYRTIFDVTGRLLLPAHLAFTVLIVAGLARLPRAAATAGAGVFMAAGLLATFTSLHAAYAPRLVDEVPPLQGSAYVFDDTVRLLGYHHPAGTFSGELDTVTLCWEVLQPTDRLAAYAVRYVKDGVPAASRTTVHGLGKYNSTLWEPGAVFCDAVDMPVGDPLFGASPPEAGVTYDILVVMLDAQTLDVNWQATTPDGTPVQFPVLGQLTYQP